MSEKLEIDFSESVSDIHGDPIKVPVKENGSVKTDDEGNVKKEEISISDHILGLINRAEYQNLKERKKANRIMGLIADEEVGKYEKSHVKWIIDKVESQMPVEDKAPVVMSNIADLLDIEEGG